MSQTNTNYSITSAGNFTLTAVDATCPTMTAYDGIYDGEHHTISVGNDAIGGVVQYRTSTNGTWSTTNPARKDIGTTTVYVRVSGDDNHNTKDCGSRTLRITAREITIKAKDQMIAYGESIQEGVNQIQVTSGALATGDVISGITLTPSTTSVTTIGTITPSAVVIKDSINNDITNNYTISYQSGTLAITGIAATCPTLTAYEGTYDGQNHTITVGNDAEGGTVQYRTSTTGSWSTTAPTRKDVGTTTVYVQVVGDENHNNADCGSSMIVISKKGLTASATAANKTYDGTIDATCTISLSGIIGNDNVTATATGLFVNKNVGTNKGVACSNITLGGTNKDNYSVGNSVNTTANITAREITIKAKNQTIAFGENLVETPNQVEISNGELATGDAISSITLTPSTTDVTTTGTITPSAATIKDNDGSGASMTDNYIVNYATGNLTIVTVAAECPSATSYSGVYDGVNHTITVGNNANGGTLEYRTSATGEWTATKPTRKDAGTTTVYIRVAGDNNYAPVECGSRDINITAKELTSAEIPDYTATWIVGTNVYTKSISTGVGSERVTITYTPYENAIGEYTYSTTAGSGKYTISQPDSNYIITGAGKLTLVKVDATCPTMSAYNGAYDAESHTITVGNDAVGGTVEYRTSATGEWSTTKPTRKEAGTTIVYVRVEGDDNHNTKDCGNKSLTIVARDITITANNQTITYGESIQEGLSQIEVTSGSLVNGENITEITLTPSTTEVTTSGTITPSAATIKDGINNDVTDNYNITYESGALTILSLEEYFEYDSSLVYDETNGILGNILVNTTKSGLLDILDSDAELAIIDKNDNNIANTDIIKTGYKLRLIRPRGIDTLTLSVRGDSTGDGKVNMNDVTAAYRHYRKKTIINDPARLMAADVVGAKDVNMNDITRIYRIFRGTAQ